jgi:hypothetical protein
MRQKTLYTFFLFILVSGAFAQKMQTKFNAASQKRNNSFPSNKKGQALGVHCSFSDFITPGTFKNSPKPINQSERKFPNIKDLSTGFSVSYWRGITPRIDFSGKVNTVFYDYAAIYRGASGKNEIGLELEPAVNIRPFNDDNLWAPFLTVGLGGGLYSDKVGAYVPVGGGLQLNFSGTTYLFVQGQYHFTLTKKILGDNLVWSVGFAESF